MRRRLGLLILLLSLAAHVAAQAAPRASGTWLALGAGGGNTGMSGAVSLTHRRGVHGLTARAVLTTGLSILTPRVSASTDLGILYGVHLRGGQTLFAARAGGSVFWYDDNRFGRGPARSPPPQLGLPWEVGVTGMVGRNFGIGLGVIGDLNPLQSMYAVMLSIHLGEAY
jgi:hypothetical protein